MIAVQAGRFGTIRVPAVVRNLEQLFAGSMINMTSGTSARSLDSAVCQFSGGMPGHWDGAEWRSRS